MTTNDGSQGKRVDLAKGHGVADGIRTRDISLED